VIKYSIIIPAYNEEAGIKGYLSNLTKFFDVRFPNYEIIVIDDGSVDKTAKEIKAVKSNKIKYIKFIENQGKGKALKFGFSQSKGNIVIFIDAGGDFPPKQISNFIKAIEQDKFDIAIANKWDKKSRINYSLKRKIFSKIFRKINSILFKINISDTQAGLKALNKKRTENIISKVENNGFVFDLELLILASRNNLKIIELPVILNWKNKKGGINLKTALKMLKQTLTLRNRLIKISNN